MALKNKKSVSKQFKTHTGAIFLNFVENNKHGCDFNCNFCTWKILNEHTYMSPTNESIAEFVNSQINVNDTACIQISGGGDPLYNFEKNKHELIRIINCLHENNIKRIELITKKFNVINDFDDIAFENITSYCFSTNSCSEELLNTINKLKSAGKYVRIACVYNGKDDHAVVEELFNYYKNVVDRVTVRLDWNICEEYSDEDILLENSWVKTLGENARLSAAKKLLLPVLINDEVWTCYDIDKTILKIRS